MKVFIPTLNRFQQDTFKSLPKHIQEDVIFVRGPGPFTLAQMGLAYATVISCPYEGIGKTRQWIIDQCSAWGIKKCLMLDDDLVFATRRDDEPTKFKDSTTAELLCMFEQLDRCLDDYAHVGVATREGGNRDVNTFAYNTRLLRILGYRTDVLAAEYIRFDRVELMEDFDVALQLLERGYQNCKLNWIVHNQRSSNAPGGCSTYRTLEKQAEAAYRLAELHPQFVKTVVKTTKSAWNGKTRVDVNIQWKQALLSAGKTVVLDQRTESDIKEEASK